MADRTISRPANPWQQCNERKIFVLIGSRAIVRDEVVVGQRRGRGHHLGTTDNQPAIRSFDMHVDIRTLKFLIAIDGG